MKQGPVILVDLDKQILDCLRKRKCSNGIKQMMENKDVDLNLSQTGKFSNTT